MRRDFKLQKNKCALIVIDMQKYFCDKKSTAYVPGVDTIKSKINMMINVFDKHQRPIIFTRHIDTNDKDNMMLRWWSENIKEDNPMSEIIEDLDTKKGEVIVKHQYEAFLGTNLEKILMEKEVKQVVICGVLTNLCCETTARSAFMRGFEVFFTMDSTATYTEDMHKATLLNLSYGFAILITADKIIKDFRVN